MTLRISNNHSLIKSYPHQTIIMHDPSIVHNQHLSRKTFRENTIEQNSNHKNESQRSRFEYKITRELISIDEIINKQIASGKHGLNEYGNISPNDYVVSTEFSRMKATSRSSLLKNNKRAAKTLMLSDYRFLNSNYSNRYEN